MQWLTCLVAVFFCSLGHQLAESRRQQQVLVLVLDGFRQDYLDRYKLASFKALLQRSTRVPAFIPEMPTQCFPNFYSLFTGREPLKHGLVANIMQDSSANRTFLGGVQGNWDDPVWWNRSEPIWVSAKKQGHRAALFNWPTCDLPIFGAQYMPDRCQPYREYGNELAPATNSNASDQDGMTTYRHSAVRFGSDLNDALEELRQGSEFVGVFTDLVDVLGHIHGPEDEQLGEALRRELEPSLNQMLAALEGRLSETVNVVMLSDHGMSSIQFDLSGKPRTLQLNQLWTYKEVQHTYDGGAYVSIYPTPSVLQEPEGLERLRSKLMRRNRWHDAVKFYLRDELIASMLRWDAGAFEFTGPMQLKFPISNQSMDVTQYVETAIRDRIAPIVAVAQPGWFLLTKDVGMQLYSDRVVRGWHGYDPFNTDMWGLFLAFGPAFEAGRQVDAQIGSAGNSHGYLRARDAYFVLADLLGLQTAPHNASRDRVDFVLRRSTATESPLERMRYGAETSRSMDLQLSTEVSQVNTDNLQTLPQNLSHEVRKSTATEALLLERLIDDVSETYSNMEVQSSYEVTEVNINDIQTESNELRSSVATKAQMERLSEDLDSNTIKVQSSTEVSLMNMQLLLPIMLLALVIIVLCLFFFLMYVSYKSLCFETMVGRDAMLSANAKAQSTSNYLCGFGWLARRRAVRRTESRLPLWVSDSSLGDDDLPPCNVDQSETS